MKDVIVIPRAALREGNHVLIVDEQSRLQRRRVTVAWNDETRVVVTEGLHEGDVVTLTSLSIAADGTPVQATIDGVSPTRSGVSAEARDAGTAARGPSSR